MPRNGKGTRLTSSLCWCTIRPRAFGGGSGTRMIGQTLCAAARWVARVTARRRSGRGVSTDKDYAADGERAPSSATAG